MTLHRTAATSTAALVAATTTTKRLVRCARSPSPSPAPAPSCALTSYPATQEGVRAVLSGRTARAGGERAGGGRTHRLGPLALRARRLGRLAAHVGHVAHVLGRVLGEDGAEPGLGDVPRVRRGGERAALGVGGFGGACGRAEGARSQPAGRSRASSSREGERGKEERRSEGEEDLPVVISSLSMKLSRPTRIVSMLHDTFQLPGWKLLIEVPASGRESASASAGPAREERARQDAQMAVLGANRPDGVSILSSGGAKG